MSKVQLFVEGIADAKLIQDILKSWYNVNLKIGKLGSEDVNPDILIVGGKGNIKKIANQFKENHEFEIKNIIIFDADIFYEENDKFIELKKKFPIEYFLLPDNQADGDLETLLVQIINQENKVIFNCWDGYESCLKTSKRKEGVFTTPASKTKIYAYLEALLGESDSQKKKIKEAERNYQDSTHWDLNAPALTNLKTFLDQYFK